MRHITSLTWQVLCGILKIPLASTLLGLLPVFLPNVAPMTLSGAFQERAGRSPGSIWEPVADVMLTMALAVQCLSLLVVAVYTEDALSNKMAVISTYAPHARQPQQHTTQPQQRRVASAHRAAAAASHRSTGRRMSLHNVVTQCRYTCRRRYADDEGVKALELAEAARAAETKAAVAMGRLPAGARLLLVSGALSVVTTSYVLFGAMDVRPANAKPPPALRVPRAPLGPGG